MPTTAPFNPDELVQSWPLPSSPSPVVIFGAGSIVRDAHLLAYKKAGIPVAGIFDPNLEKAHQLCEEWNLTAFTTEAAALNHPQAIFDLATPPAAHATLLNKLPHGSSVLIQKPMGSDLDDASRILRICQERHLNAAVNFQLRFAPMMLALKHTIDAGYLGRIVDFDAWLALDTPWHLWKFLESLERVEIAVHSIHYLDFVRSLLGNPQGVHAKTVSHPRSGVAQSRTAVILDYGDDIRCSLSINHDHFFGRKFQASEFRICGTEGAAYIKLGVNLDYPKGEPDELWVHPAGSDDWVQVNLSGSWFPDAFLGPISNVQRMAHGDDSHLISSVADAWHTMSLVESAFLSSAQPATPVATLPGEPC
ncbi:MAG: Gfo/Idh/MocA family oxidoreductase [Gammaproteobacteria bacterium]|nr:Gfo/Idh/MocA family oxidoreductase [Gammaproteobacteria bacterium]